MPQHQPAHASSLRRAPAGPAAPGRALATRVLPAALLLGLCALAPPAALAAEEEPTFWLIHQARGVVGGDWYRSEVQERYELCDDWPQPAARPGAAPGQKASRSRDLFTRARGLRGLSRGARLHFCRVGGSGHGQDSAGSDASLAILPDGRAAARGVAVEAGSPPVRTPFAVEDDPTDGAPGRSTPLAELERTASGARLVVRPDAVLETGGYGLFGATHYAALDKTPAQHAAWSTFELTDQDLAAFGELDRSRAISISGEPEARFTLTLLLKARLPDLGEVLVEAEGYADWRPRGDLATPAQPAAHLTVSARVQASGDGEARSDRKVRLTFTLKGVSSQKGVCNNGPAERADTSADLRLLPARNPGLEVLDETTARTRELVAEARATVSSFDYGAWGRLVVTAVDSKGRPVPVTVKGREGKVGAALPIPKDDDENRVADAWQERHGLMGRPGADDEDDRPQGNGFAGDGLTLYEEYRGFQVKGAWRETDPRKKDLFVCDETEFAGPGIGLFEVATGLAVHQVTCPELGQDRVVNRHFSEGPHVVDQHGLRIVPGPKGSDPINVGDVAIGPPRTSHHIQLPKGGAGASPSATAAQDWASDVAHELGHGTGLTHHGEGNRRAVVLRWVDGPDGGKALYRVEVDEETRQPIEQGRFITLLDEATGRRLGPDDPPPEGSKALAKGRLIIWELGKQGQASGVDTCLMRYADRGLFVSSRLPDTDYVPDPSGWRARTRLCSGAAGTGVNAPDHLPEPRYGDAVSGNCQGKLVVNDRYRTDEDRGRKDLPGDLPLPGAPGASGR
ncbi:MAG: hypothetical protein IPO09_03105 [Anaeromyxobacter sp.]|nr:hypothetical protein [Anaeromyxobacter sp.]MBL0275572.1 hypothetical protein [Anaeromyxobacter sp.]